MHKPYGKEGTVELGETCSRHFEQKFLLIVCPQSDVLDLGVLPVSGEAENYARMGYFRCCH